MAKVGRPTKYSKEMNDKVDEYLEANQDEEVEVVTLRSDKKGYEKVDTKLKVSLPTLGGFALYIGVGTTTLEQWGAKYPEFKGSLRKIVEEQKKRLLDKGLSGEYNSTIAKLVLSANHDMREKKDVTTDGKAIGTILDELE